MASINPSTLQCPPEPHSSKKAYLKLTITSISDSDATTNKRYIGWKITVEGTRWSALHGRYCELGGHVIRPLTTQQVTDWYVGDILDSGTETYDNDSSGNLTLHAFLKQLFYYFYSDSRWNSSTAQSAETDMVCSQVYRYANFTKHTTSSIGINKVTISWEADAACDAYQYSLNGGNWTTAGNLSYSISGLSPNTSYTVKTRIRRTDSQLWTESSTLTFKTQALPTPNAPSNFNLGSSLTASISSTANLSKWYCTVFDSSTQIASSGDVTATSKTIDLTSSSIVNGMLSRHTSANSWTITVKYYCVSNGTTYTLAEKTCTCTIPAGSYAPTFNANNISYAVTDNQSLNITGSNQKVIKGISDVLITISPASPNGSASMSSYNANSGNSSGSTTNTSSPTISLTNVSANSMTVQAVDSRSRTTAVTKNYSTYIDYFAPSFSTFSVNRIDGVSTNLVVNITGTYCNWTGLSTTNIITQVSLKYKLKSASTWTTISGINLTITNNSGNFTASGNITGNLFATANEYDFQVILQDKITQLPKTVSIPAGQALLWRDLANKRIGIGKKPDYTLDVNGIINTTDFSYSKVRNRAVSKVGSDSASTNGWYKVCSSTMSGYGNTNIVWLIKDNYDNGKVGIFDLEMRSNSSSIDVWKAQWLTKTGFATNCIRIVISGMSWTLYINRTVSQYGRISFIELQHNSINGANNAYNITYYDSTTKESSEPSGTNSTLGGDVNWALYSDNAAKVTTGSRNTSDTWIPVLRSGTLDYTTRYMPHTQTHSQYNTEQDRLVTLNFMSFWNGAFNASGNSNLTYCNKGAFGTIVTKNTGDYWTVPTTGTSTVGGTTWRYIKFPNGYAVCWGNKTINTKINSAWGNLQSSGEKALDNYPFTFTELPAVNITCVSRGTSWSAFIGSSGNGSTTSNPGSILLLRGNNSASLQDYGICIVAWGKWN